MLISKFLASLVIVSLVCAVSGTRLGGIGKAATDYTINEDFSFWQSLLGRGAGSMPTSSPTLDDVTVTETEIVGTTTMTELETTASSAASTLSTPTSTETTTMLETTASTTDVTDNTTVTTTESMETTVSTTSLPETTAESTTESPETITTPSPLETTETTTLDMETCTIETSVECVFDSGVSCSDLTLISPEDATCVLPNGPTELGWIYRGTNCDDSSTNFECADFDGGPDGNPLVNLLIENDAGEELVRETGVSLDEAFTIPAGNGVALDDEMSVIIYIGADETDGVLQTMSGIPTGCNESEDLVLGDSFGALEFSSYRDDSEFVQAIQPVEWKYSVVNTGPVEALLTEVESVTNGDTLSQTPNTEIEPNNGFSFVVPSEINLLSAGSYTGEVSAIASPVTADGVECGDTSSNTVALS